MNQEDKIVKNAPMGSGIRGEDARMANQEAIAKGEERGLIPGGGYAANSALTAIQNSIFGGAATWAVNKSKVALADLPEDKEFTKDLFTRIREEFPDVNDNEQERLMSARNYEEYDILRASVTAQRRLDELGASSKAATYGALALDIAPDVMIGTKGSAAITKFLVAGTAKRAGVAVGFNAAQGGGYEALRQDLSNEQTDTDAIKTTIAIAGGLGGIFDAGLQFKSIRDGAVKAAKASKNATTRLINGGKPIVDDAVEAAKAGVKAADEFVTGAKAADDIVEGATRTVDDAAQAATKTEVTPATKAIVDDLLGESPEALKEADEAQAAMDDLFEATATTRSRAHALKSAKFDEDLSAIKTSPENMEPVSLASKTDAPAAPVVSSTDSAINAYKDMLAQSDEAATPATQDVATQAADDVPELTPVQKVETEAAYYNAKGLTLKDGDNKVSLKFESPVDRALVVLGSKSSKAAAVAEALEVVQKAFPEADAHAIQTMADDLVDNILMPRVRASVKNKKLAVARWWDEVDLAQYKDRIQEVTEHIAPEATKEAVETAAKVSGKSITEEAGAQVIKETVNEVNELVTRETIEGGLKELEAAHPGVPENLTVSAELMGKSADQVSVLETQLAAAGEIAGRKAFDAAKTVTDDWGDGALAIFIRQNEKVTKPGGNFAFAGVIHDMFGDAFNKSGLPRSETDKIFQRISPEDKSTLIRMLDAKISPDASIEDVLAKVDTDTAFKKKVIEKYLTNWKPNGATKAFDIAGQVVEREAASLDNLNKALEGKTADADGFFAVDFKLHGLTGTDLAGKKTNFRKPVQVVGVRNANREVGLMGEGHVTVEVKVLSSGKKAPTVYKVPVGYMDNMTVSLEEQIARSADTEATIAASFAKAKKTKQGGFASPHVLLANVALGSALFFAMTDDAEAAGGAVAMGGLTVLLGKGGLLLAGAKAWRVLKQKGIKVDTLNEDKKMAEKLWATNLQKITKQLEDYELTDAAPAINQAAYLKQQNYLAKVQRDQGFLELDPKTLANPLERARLEMAQETVRQTIERLKTEPFRNKAGDTVDFYDMTPAARLKELKATLVKVREDYIEKVTGVQYRGLKVINTPPKAKRPENWAQQRKIAAALRAWGPEDALRDLQSVPLKRDAFEGTVVMQKDSILDDPKFREDMTSQMLTWYRSKTHLEDAGKQFKDLGEVITPEMRAKFQDAKRLLDEEFLKLDPMDIRNKADSLRLEMVQEALRAVIKRLDAAAAKTKGAKRYHELNAMQRAKVLNDELNEFAPHFIKKKTGFVKENGKLWYAADVKQFPEMLDKYGRVTEYSVQQYLKSPGAREALTAYQEGPYLMLGGKALARVAASKSLMGDSLVANWDEAKRMFAGGADWDAIERSTGFTVRDGELVLKVEPDVFPGLLKGGKVDSKVLAEIMENAKAFAEDGTPLTKAVTFNLDANLSRLEGHANASYEKISMEVNGKTYDAQLPHWLRKARADYLRLAMDKSKTAVGIGMLLATGVVTRVGKVATQMAADQLYKSTQTSNLGRVEQSLQLNFNDWYQQTGRKKPNILNRKQILADREDFAKEVTDAKQFPDDPKWSEATRKTAAAIAKIEAEHIGRIKQLVEWSEARGVKFAEDNPLKLASQLEADPRFVSRVVNKDQWNAIEAAVGRDGVIKLIAAGYKRADTKLTDEKIKQIATDIYTTLTESQDNMGIFVNKATADKIETKMRDAGESQENIDFVTSLFGVRSGGRTPGMLKKRRLELDMNASVKFTVEGKEVTYRLADLYERDITKLFGRWSHTMSGLEALGTAGLKDGINLTDDVEWDAYVARMKDEGVDPENLKIMEAYRDLMLARAKDPDVFGNPGNLERLIRTAATYWLGSNFVLAQAGDIGGLGGTALRNLFKAIPLMKEIQEGIKSGKYSIEELKELASILDLGMDTISATTNNFIENGVDIGANMAERLVHFQHKINGMHFIMHAVKMAKALEVQDFLVKYVKGDMVDERMWKHLSSFGLDKAVADELAVLLNKPGMLRYDADGVFKGINFEAMMKEDIVLARKFQMSMQKAANYANAQSVGFGETAQFFRANTLGRFMGQLQGTAMFITQKTHRDLMNFDGLVMNAWITSMAFSAMSYMARVGMRYAGDEEELEKKLSYQNIFLASIRNSSFAGVAPNVIDAFLSTTGIVPGGVFSGGSNSGRVGGELAVQAGFKTPVTALAGIMGMMKMDEYDVLTQSEARAAVQTLAPFWFVSPVVSAATAGLETKNPKRPPEPQDEGLLN